MEQKFNLTISKPCSEKFNQFNKTEKGGFCNSCQKEVIDFRTVSDEQLIKYFKSKEGKTCGYFSKTQLNRDFQIPEFEQSSRYKFFKIAAVAFLSLTSLHNIQAQNQKDKTEIIESSKQNNNSNDNRVQEVLLTGSIVEESGPLPGANIVLKGTTIGTSTNFDGKFEFPKPLKEGDILVVSYLGYVTKEIKINKAQTELNAILNINMEEDLSCVLLGEVEVNEVYKSKRSFWQKIKGIF